MSLDEIVMLVEATNEAYGGGKRERKARGDLVAYVAGLAPVSRRSFAWLIPVIYALGFACLAAFDLVQLVAS